MCVVQQLYLSSQLVSLEKEFAALEHVSNSIPCRDVGVSQKKGTILGVPKISTIVFGRQS